MTTDTPTAVRRRFTLVSLVLPAVATVLALAVQLILLPQVPAVVATHWSWGGTPDGFAPGWTVPLVTVILGGGLPAVIFAIASGGLRRGDHGSTYRLLGAIALGTAVLAGGLGVATLGIHVGQTDAADVTLPALLVPSVLVAAVAAGAVGWGVQPDAPWRPTPAAAGADVPVRAGERVVWMQAVSIARPGAVVLGTCVAIAGVAVLVLALASETLAVWIAVLATAVVALSILANARFHVRVDSDGLFLVSAVGWPRVQVPIAEVVSAEVVDVAPMAEFGGWGMRWAADRRFGVVLRAGEGILVRRTDGRSVTVTVDDAATGAGLLNAYAALTRDRARD